MGDQQGQGTGQPVNEAAIAAELLSLRGTLYPFVTQEQRLEIQRAQIQEHIARYETQISAARAANNESLARAGEERRDRLKTHLPIIQQQLEAVRQQTAPLLQRQSELQATLRTLQSQQQSAVAPLSRNWPGQPRRKRRARRLVLYASILIASTLLTVLVLGRVTRAPLGGGAAAAHPTQQGTVQLPTATPTPPPLDAFRPNGTAPTTQNCLNAGYVCYSPEQIQQAFGLTALYKSGYSGRGQTIVILGTGKTTTLQQDLHQFDVAWGLPDPPSFQILKPKGEPIPYTCPDGDDSLQIENTLDVEWSHALAPGANIVMLIWSNGPPGTPKDEACYMYDITGGVAYALSNHLGQVISISYGGSELGDVSETTADHNSDFVYYRNHADLVFKRAAAERVTVLAATGDDGVTNPSDFTKDNVYWPKPNVDWPASDPYVLAVGGTTLQTFGNGTYNGESVWKVSNGAAGGGLSAVFSEPDYQKGLPDQSMLQGKRAIPDVSFPAAAEYSLYGSFQQGEMGRVSGRWNHWGVIGGTSASAPCWAGLVALGNQILGVALGDFHDLLYKLHGRGLHDITRGNNSFGGVPGYTAGPGYDLATGWGTPIADEFFQALYDEINPIQQIQCGVTIVCT